MIVEKLINPKAIIRTFLISIAFVVLMGFWTTSATSASKGKPEFPRIFLLDRFRGERAIQVLADKLPEVAAWYGKSPEQFSDMLRHDHTCRIDMNGRLLFIDDAPEEIDGSEAALVAAESVSLADTFILHSLPGSKRTIYLDFDGHTTTGTAWNTYFSAPEIASPAYDLDGDSSTFSDAEKTRIQKIWKLVSEDYAPFDVDVTTEDPGQDAITRSNINDDIYGTRVVMTVDNFASCGCGGFAYVGVFDYTGDSYKPAFVFNKSEKGASEAASHEAGHNLGLSHDGVKDPTSGITVISYYQGHGSGATGWAPIMGVGYNKELVQWSSGEYTNANNTEDDIQIIQNNGAPLLVDVHGNDQANASNIPGGIFSISGIIESRTDVDFFRFYGGGDVSINTDSGVIS